jgi:hypothetical protein
VLGPTDSPARSNPNSASTCRQAPHGIAGGSDPTTMTMRRNRRAPAVTALATAERSAQIVSPKDAFSILQPV